MIDVGGPVDAARARRRTSPTSRPSAGRSSTRRCSPSCARRGELSRDTRRRLAAEAFATTAAYEAAIATLVRRPRERFPSAASLASPRCSDLAYGENPHQRGGVLRRGRRAPRTCSRASTSCTGRSSRSTTSTTSRRRGCSLREFTLPACVIVKHANPCGVAVAATIEEAYEQALACDPVSAYGGVVVLNRPVCARARRGVSREQFVEVADRARLRRRGARGAAREAGDADPARPRAARRRPRRAGHTSACSAACSSRTATGTSRTARAWRSSAATPTEGGWGDLLFAWRVVQARRLERDRAREGPADDRDRRRPDEPRRRGADRAREGAGARPRPARAPCSPPTRSSRSPTARSSRSRPASRAIIQPGGSKRDDEVIAAVDGGGRRRWSSRAAATSGTESRH